MDLGVVSLIFPLGSFPRPFKNHFGYCLDILFQKWLENDNILSSLLHLELQFLFCLSNAGLILRFRSRGASSRKPSFMSSLQPLIFTAFLHCIVIALFWMFFFSTSLSLVCLQRLDWMHHKIPCSQNWVAVQEIILERMNDWSDFSNLYIYN